MLCRRAIYEERADFAGAATHFVDAFWADKAELRTLTREQRRRLQRDQVDEFNRRYGRVSSRRKSSLFVALDDGDSILGCAGVEIEDPLDGTAVEPLMSNLAVAVAGRRQGLAQQLVRACELKARDDWGHATLALVVEERNLKARSLYSKLGYRVVAKDATATTLRPLSDGRIVTETTTTLTMRRNLIVPPLGLARPLAAVALVFALVSRSLPGLIQQNPLTAPLLSSATFVADNLRRLVDQFPPPT
ncbi:hypothetical protein CTAYLR_000404 [Chrysophaeum taylorii]|uniref:N-acetyltransferase domain-containing protein n=1 Tax=Chrysophaeum taylorii TaxID=2483200 RepID=A0AAD7UFW1_9STRA|nr:hypothetical protein CTAYLR_000404 [Chrysophaeum taylorii]